MNNQKHKVGPGMYVAFTYQLIDEKDGSTLFEVSGDAPDMMVVGTTKEIVPGLAAAMNDLSAGDKFSVTLPPEAAFGERYEENIIPLEREIFEEDGKLLEEVKVDAQLPMMTQEGFRVMGRVIGIDDKHVTMDFNHPFAGKTVTYNGQVTEVRPATEEEKKPAQGGCGGCCGGGSCGDGNCGDGCGDGKCGC